MDISSAGVCCKDVQMVWDMHSFKLKRCLILPHANHNFPQSLYRGYITDPPASLNTSWPVHNMQKQCASLLSLLALMHQQILGGAEGSVSFAKACRFTDQSHIVGDIA